MGSKKYTMVGVFIDLPSIQLKKMALIHSCTNETCEKHKTELKKINQFCFMCGHPAGKVEREQTYHVDADDFAGNGLITTNGEVNQRFLYDSDFVTHIDTDGYIGSLEIDFDKAKEKIERFKEKHQNNIEKIQTQINHSLFNKGQRVKVFYGVVTYWT